MDEFETKSLEIATFLAAHGVILKMVKRDDYVNPAYPNNRIGIFVFENRVKCEYLERVYMGPDNDDRLMDARSVLEAGKRLKSILRYNLGVRKIN